MLFGTDGIRGIANKEPITPEIMVRLGKAIAVVLKNSKERPRILIGKDTRLSGYMIESALTSGICSMGADVLLVGPMPTPAIAHLTKSFAADAGIVISASHNPAEHNGIKIFSKEGIKLGKDREEEIERLVSSNNFQNSEINGHKIGKAYRIDDAKGRYIEFAKGTIGNMPLTGLKVVLDCANGAAYNIAPPIFRELGTEVVVLADKPNGLNINKACGSLYPQLIKNVLKEEKADIGIALDGDADRVILIDEKGNEIDGDQTMAIIALDLSKQNKLNKNTLVATVMSNKELDNIMKKNKIAVVRTDVGDPNVCAEMLKNSYNFGGEQSGHILFLEHNTAPDGVVTALHVLKIMKKENKVLSELAAVLKPLPQLLLNVDVREKRDFEEMPSVVDKIKKAEEKLGNRGRILVRYSGTENRARVMIEGEHKEIQKIAEEIAAEIKKEVG